MKIRFYPANENCVDFCFTEFEVEALPRIGDFVQIPLKGEQEWARKALLSKSNLEAFSQWLDNEIYDNYALNFGDAMYVSRVRWLYDEIQDKIIPYITLDCGADESIDDIYSTRDISEEEYEIIKANTFELYNL